MMRSRQCTRGLHLLAQVAAAAGDVEGSDHAVARRDGLDADAHLHHRPHELHAGDFSAMTRMQARADTHCAGPGVLEQHAC